MTIDVNLLRAEKGGDPALVRDSEVRRGRSGEVVDQAVAVDKKWRENLFQLEQLKKELNAVNKEIGQRKKKDAKDPCQDLLAKSAELKQRLPTIEAAATEAEEKRESLLHKIGNIVHKSVPVSNDEVNNQVVRTWGTFDRNLKIDGTPGRMHHHQILARLGGVDFKKGVEAAGHRGYFLKGAGMLLNLALAQYGLAFLLRKGYTPVQPPFFMRKEVMARAAELKDFEETLYRIPHNQTGGSADSKEGAEKNGEKKNEKDADRDDLFLIATSEQPLCSLHMNETLEEKELPIRYAGYSSCFRKEAGSHGKDCWGIFRIHQFEKVEQFCITTPEESWKMHEDMIGMAEEFYQTLELPYRVVSIVSGALNDAAAKKYDLEAWFPGYGDFRELVSCSNCTDYQARALDIRLAHKSSSAKGADRNEKAHVHMLNGTLVATQRCLCCILENYQTPLGVKVPRVLVPYMGGAEFLPFVDAGEESVKKESA
ncbi:seryl-tRNA synthetase, cytoplasmic, putative [Toxoplasma gondii ME49]|uniref:serine--tRNA ligase n=4 Tax=Toxoplasma gondii TaxID=5811 RepID=B6KHT7_TOXGV|nr:seryl-tRNA synthetase, cytoplasmic, putative [Toxoplasma gondii ME49]ESS34564.1 putative seryl-tRNA synthetase, cytoplasmic [Toxoplasma gondii VEG]KYF40367.1 putative seryl-tRNA synthetase, cytoplasmic [Toxoplasma gondii ARI]PIL97174.1 putative seryl-tRNA synthetase, cytoplasmic [Toxoplasma gondii COUG]EPT25234.1 seryl-tRNA synthetase, cytoplasmic, putative [Toxoplasma gondii ME49]CEL78688.1 TPA: seryl-tRNA synthetase, putative [Toxoplasma gondii VEG]|eukprot:XP_002367409.1 seryl-tRNA synthetase, cytoplasmic, putative [Toxoplasma gondii ME49]